MIYIFCFDHLQTGSTLSTKHKELADGDLRRIYYTFSNINNNRTLDNFVTSSVVERTTGLLKIEMKGNT